MKTRYSLLAAMSVASLLAFPIHTRADYSWGAFSYDPWGGGWSYPMWWSYSNWGNQALPVYRYTWVHPSGYPYGWSQFQYWGQPNAATMFWTLPLNQGR